MRKKIALALTGMVAFDLGTVVVHAQSASVDYFLKIDSLPNEFNFTKIEMDAHKTAGACTAKQGTLVEFKGDKYCRTAKAGVSSRQPSTALPATTGPATAVPSTADPATAAPPNQRR